MPKSNDILFVEDCSNDLRYEISIAANYSADPVVKERGHAFCDDLALDRSIPQWMRDIARRNLYWYSQALSELAPSFERREVGFTPPEGWRPLNPSVCKIGAALYMVVRTVNYFRTDTAHYEVPPGEPIRTRNHLLLLRDDLSVEHSWEILPPLTWPRPEHGRIIGFEDMRLFDSNGPSISATVIERNSEGWCEQFTAALGSGNSDVVYLMNPRAMNPEGERRNQKNWMPVSGMPVSGFLYQSDPTRLVDHEGRTVWEHIPSIAADNFRGGSQLIPFNGGFLALVHIVHTQGDRHYQHRFVWFDAELALRAASREFYFHHRGIEFAAGLCWDVKDERLVISYGVKDRESWLGMVSPGEVAAMLRPCAASPVPTPSVTVPALVKVEEPVRSVVEGDVDLVVEAAFFPDPGFKGTMVEVGAARPDFLSVGAHFRAKGWRVISIEPNPSFARMHRDAGHEIIECACSAMDQDDVPFTVVHTNGDYYGHKVTDESFSSLGMRGKYTEQLGTINSSADEIRVKTRRLDTILHEAGITDVDILCIDVEGWEIEVLNGLSFDIHQPKVLIVENLFHEQSYIDHMARHGYALWKTLNPNDVFVTNGRIADLLFKDADWPLANLPSRRGVVQWAGTEPLPSWVRSQTNRPLRHRDAVDYACNELAKVAPLHPDRPKNWDTLLAVHHALSWAGDVQAPILDAGAGKESAFLPAMYRLGHRDLIGVNLLFDKPEAIGGICYEPGDITKLSYPDAHFQFIACLSVIEHGVDVPKFLAEAARVLRPGGSLFLSFDYWNEPIDYSHWTARGVEMGFFNSRSALNLIVEAGLSGLRVDGSDPSFETQDAVVHHIGLDYTFMNLLFRKV